MTPTTNKPPADMIRIRHRGSQMDIIRYKLLENPPRFLYHRKRRIRKKWFNRLAKKTIYRNCTVIGVSESNPQHGRSYNRLWQ